MIYCSEYRLRFIQCIAWGQNTLKPHILQGSD